MSAGLALHRVDDDVRAYWVLAAGQRVGEVRMRPYGTGELHLREGRYLLRRDDTADAVKQGAGVLRATLLEAAPRARYSLREDEAVLARAAQRFHPLSARRCGLSLWPGAADVEWTMTSRGAFSGRWTVDAAGATVGEVTSHRFGRQVAWNGPSVPEPVAAFALFALHQRFGSHPSSGTDAGGE